MICSFFKKSGLNEQPLQNFIRKILLILVMLLPFGWMTYRGAFGFTCALILLVSIIQLTINNQFKIFFRERYSFFVVLCLSAIFLSVLITQLLRGEFYIQAYDGPLRLILALPILVVIFQLKINFGNLISYALPLALINIFIYALLSSNNFYGTRLTNNYLDPIIWGNFSIILGFICLASINPEDSNRLRIYKLLGLALGISMSILSQSRSGWIAGIIMAITWALLNINKISIKKLIATFIVAIIFFTILYFTFTTFKHRIDSTFIEVISWINQTQPISSSGIRLTMWKISWYLFRLSPWIGYGEFSTLPIMSDSYILSFADSESMNTILCCGPHNEIAARLLQSGLLGFTALTICYLGPIYIFLKSKHRQSRGMGIILCIGMIVSGLTGEMLTLKASYNFYAIFISGLLATTLWGNHEQK